MKNIILSFCVLVTMFFIGCDKSLSINNNSNGVGGSLARFTVVNNMLYSVDNQNLKVFNISNPATPEYKATIEIGFDIETIYPFKNKLFIGARSAMYIYNIDNPELPVYEGMASHVTACDPIVANDSIAYLTVRSNVTCAGVLNELQVYNIEETTSPKFIGNFSLTNPHGLGLNDTILYVCDAEAGLQIINVSDNRDPIKISNINNFNFLDCIVLDELLLCMISDGLALYNISDAANPVFIEKL